MIELNNNLLIGTGRDRACYYHPQDPQLCIKVALRPEKQTYREKRYFRLLQKQKKDITLLALYRGTIETNLGLGALYDLIRDDNGHVSPTLTEAIRSKHINADQVKQLSAQLKDYLFSEVISVRDLSPNNVMIQTHQGILRPVIVDGVSNPGVNPLNIRCAVLAKYFLRRSWTTFTSKLQRLLHD